MRLKDVQRTDTKDVILTVRVNREDAEWLKGNNISPSLLFSEALKELKGQVNTHKEAEDKLKKFASPKKLNK